MFTTELKKVLIIKSRDCTVRAQILCYWIVLCVILILTGMSLGLLLNFDDGTYIKTFTYILHEVYIDMYEQSPTLT